MKLIDVLKALIKNAVTLDDYIIAFRDFCSIETDFDEDACFFEADNYDFTGEEKFYFSLVRQYKNDENADEYTQIHLDIIFEPLENIKAITIWSDEYENNTAFFNSVKQSEPYQFIKQNHLIPKRVYAYIDQT